MKHTLITITMIASLLLLGTYSCIRSINSNRDLVNLVLEYYPDYEIEILEDDPNRLLISIEK